MKPEALSSASDAHAASSHDAHTDEPRSWLSALVDGDVNAAQKACTLWRDDEDARRTWHAYHLIGDVMRSEELATPPARDSAFLAGVRARLAAEPVVLAPEAVAPKPVRRRQPWLVPTAAAAGFAAVAGVLVVTRLGLPGGAMVDTAVAVRESAPSAGVMPTRQVLMRDARLDEFLRAHQSVRGGMGLVAPGGGLRRVDLPVAAVMTPASASPGAAAR